MVLAVLDVGTVKQVKKCARALDRPDIMCGLLYQLPCSPFRHESPEVYVLVGPIQYKAAGCSSNTSNSGSSIALMNGREIQSILKECRLREHVSLQALGVMEGEAGNIDEAREFFERSTNEDPTHVQSWQVTV